MSYPEAVARGRRGQSLDDTDETPLIAPPRRDELVYDHQIADRYFGGLPRIRNKLRWVREHLPRDKRIKIGGASAWYARDVLAYIASLRGRSSGRTR